MRQFFARENYAWASDKRSFSHTYILSLQRSQRVYTPSNWMGLEYDWFPFGARSIFRGHVSFGGCNPNQINSNLTSVYKDTIGFREISPLSNTTLSTLTIPWLWYTRSDYWKYNWSLLRGIQPMVIFRDHIILDSILDEHQKLQRTLPTEPLRSCDRAIRYSGWRVCSVGRPLEISWNDGWFPSSTGISWNLHKETFGSLQ